MRKIVFRAWDKKYGIMLEGIELTKLLGYLLFQDRPNSDAYRLMKDHFKEIEWLEFTGLKDKNGKDIFEGDVLARKFFAHWVVSYKGASFCMHNVNDPSRLYILEQSFDREIIGNIYENPELLEQVKP